MATRAAEYPESSGTGCNVKSGHGGHGDGWSKTIWSVAPYWRRSIYSRGRQDNFVLKPRALWIGLEIEIAAIAFEIGKLSEIAFDHDFDFDDCWPTLELPSEHAAIYHFEIIEILQRTKWPWLTVDTIASVVNVT